MAVGLCNILVAEKYLHVLNTNPSIHSKMHSMTMPDEIFGDINTNECLPFIKWAVKFGAISTIEHAK